MHITPPQHYQQLLSFCLRYCWNSISMRGPTLLLRVSNVEVEGNEDSESIEDRKRQKNELLKQNKRKNAAYLTPVWRSPNKKTKRPPFLPSSSPPRNQGCSEPPQVGIQRVSIFLNQTQVRIQKISIFSKRAKVLIRKDCHFRTPLSFEIEKFEAFTISKSSGPNIFFLEAQEIEDFELSQLED